MKLNFWSACKVCYKTTFGALPKHRILPQGMRRLAEHNRMIVAFLAIWEWLKSIASAFPENATEFMESTRDWLRIFKLGAKLTVLQFKLHILARKQRNLLREQNELLLKQINNVL